MDQEAELKALFAVWEATGKSEKEISEVAKLVLKGWFAGQAAMILLPRNKDFIDWINGKWMHE